MEDRAIWTKANRRTTVLRTSIRSINKDSHIRPPERLLTHPSEAELRRAIKNGDEIWRLEVHHRTGFDEESTFHMLFTTQEKAIVAQAAYPVGAEIELLTQFPPKVQEFNAHDLSFETSLSIMGRGEPPYFLIYRALEGAGVYGQNNRLTRRVLSWVGDSGKKDLEEEFGENWEAVAALEYCVRHFHPTSLANLAARVIVADFMAESNYDAGYASRELEVNFGGAEKIALQSVETRKMAGKGGAQASRKRRQSNLEALMQELEKLVGTVGLISEERILAQAFESVAEINPRMPKSKKTRDDYETALRSEEPFKTRYEAIFRRSA
jgi:hypothetical protein